MWKFKKLVNFKKPKRKNIVFWIIIIKKKIANKTNQNKLKWNYSCGLKIKCCCNNFFFQKKNAQSSGFDTMGLIYSLPSTTPNTNQSFNNNVNDRRRSNS